MSVMVDSFTVMIAVLFSGVLAVLMIGATYVLCLRPVLSARRQYSDRRPDNLGMGTGLARRFVEWSVEPDAAPVHQRNGRRGAAAD
jgi:hypothetical protein